MKQSTKQKTPYILVANAIRERIEKRKLCAGDFIGTEIELTKETKRARMTVRRAIDLLLKEGVVERRPGRGIFVREENHNTCQIGMLAGNLLWAPAVRVSRAVQEMAGENGIDVRLYDAQGSIKEDIAAIRALPQSGNKGAVIMSQHCPEFNKTLSYLIANDFPFVLVDQALVDLEAPSVISDNFAGGAMLAGHLLEAGHTAIAFIGDIQTGTTARRLRGVEDACLKVLHKTPQIYDIAKLDRFDDWGPSVRNAVGTMLRERPDITAIICSCDSVARHVYRALMDAGHSIPGDFSVVGFDDDPLAEWLTPGLTTIRQNFTAMGHAAFTALQRLLAHPEEKPTHSVIPVTLVRRASVAPPRQHTECRHA